EFTETSKSLFTILSQNDFFKKFQQTLNYTQDILDKSSKEFSAMSEIVNFARAFLEIDKILYSLINLLEDPIKITLINKFYNFTGDFLSLEIPRLGVTKALLGNELMKQYFAMFFNRIELFSQNLQKIFIDEIIAPENTPNFIIGMVKNHITSLKINSLSSILANSDPKDVLKKKELKYFLEFFGNSGDIFLKDTQNGGLEASSTLFDNFKNFNKNPDFYLLIYNYCYYVLLIEFSKIMFQADKKMYSTLPANIQLIILGDTANPLMAYVSSLGNLGFNLNSSSGAKTFQVNLNNLDLTNFTVDNYIPDHVIYLQSILLRIKEWIR
ncbi:MAG: hypothetical protein PHN56_04530, partial [Candidatus Nanoarchaeia archaeon]|nr:hypothetical protein [Candidatus Nanoarchaeia archaeon]